MTIAEQMERALQDALGKSLKAYCEALSHKELIQPSQKASSLQAEVMRDLLAYKEVLQEGFKLADATVEKLSILDRSINYAAFKSNMLEAFGKLNTLEDLERYSKQVASGSAWSTVLGVTTESRELMYKAGQEVFSQKQYTQAEAVFCFLTTIDPMQYAFWIGLGHARFHEAKYTNAVAAYQMAIVCDQSEIWPYFYIANCYESERDFDHALSCLKDALDCYKKQDMQDKQLHEVLMARIAAIT